MNPDAPLHGDLSQRVVVDTAALDWQPSPSGTVWRKRLHRVGPAETGQVTSLVRFEPNSSFPVHAHPDGEEILVLEGTFSDDRGDWPAGCYLLNPEGYSHAPSSREGCVVLVKLRQYAGSGRRQVALDSCALDWRPVAGCEGLWSRELYADDAFPDTTRLEKLDPGTRLPERSYPGGAELFVLSGSCNDEAGPYGSGTWLRLPAGACHTLHSEGGCEVYVKSGAVIGLLAG
jgi:anti-sigma factor ChrR (cupin superfamily)